MITPNFVFYVVFILLFIWLTKSFITSSIWLALPTAWYFTLDTDMRITFLVLVVAGVYSQLVLIWKSTDEFKTSKRVS